MPGKVLLFGEYSVLYGSKALVTPFETYKGQLKLGEPHSYSHGELVKLYNYLVSKKIDHLDLERLAQDLVRGLYFDSDIPIGQGLGSSAALTAAIVDEYSGNDSEDIFGQIESFFHGKSSGLDPKVCFEKRPLMKISHEKVKKVDIDHGPIFPSYLVSTGQSRKVSDCLNLFKQELSSAKIQEKFECEYVDINNQCIHDYLHSKKTFWDKISALSQFQFDHFKSLICSSVTAIWQQGLEEHEFYMKLCGAGGGGHYLVFAKSASFSVPDAWIKVEMKS